ncbi:NAD(P)-dependent oxidoreductase (plasmid) [Gemmobacter fulvus]|uniref:NAD(P)-dependent oxidoreductase n=1 Tax=Gemmobacter fulvus TaxID=2840474 RepID=A0A975PBX3_9RHOB|nr:NAD(P)-dependent oxidoreductase [Gemmobacter fulvus]MBT9246342.1 NAD(P)-dependent oxidoreductase [Gemmobacter fulvus]QWK92306.1 NAD(P)-dependent oxidoreductase [Gemmobacter fulvus]
MGKLLVLTGASGTLGRFLAPALAAQGYRLRLSDIVAFPDPLPEGASFHPADLADAGAVADLLAGCDAVLHFGGISVEKPWAQIVGPNLLGVTHIFEAARTPLPGHRMPRVIFASSNHTIGFYERGTVLSTDDPYRTDGYYGLSKAYGELLGRMMFDKHGVENVHLRIGSALPAPTEARHLATWLSLADLLRLVIAALEAAQTGHAIVWGVSANQGRWWQGDDAARIGYVPQDDAARFAPLPERGDALTRQYQGGSFAAQDNSRAG